MLIDTRFSESFEKALLESVLLLHDAADQWDCSELQEHDLKTYEEVLANLMPSLTFLMAPESTKNED